MLLAGLFLALTLPLQVTSSSPYLCKCTCFSTNSTILPLLSPIDPSNPCTTCTRQFCLDQKLYGCEGARIENPNADTGTGWEGEVWARCFQRESGKDETIVSFYLFTIVTLLLAAALRSHLIVWWEVSDQRLLTEHPPSHLTLHTSFHLLSYRSIRPAGPLLCSQQSKLPSLAEIKSEAPAEAGSTDEGVISFALHICLPLSCTLVLK
ncbi:hypothetical protein BCV69DRAFT_246532 [Microstroma glucosiphilum]|uniref:Uncharacterized protein n=1 Tax=Pseudomicrostroma glucosiphilum TaxID=1684307 RepID=A0A316UE19_9BASI|nr:hypothetical protein BCV69DRAFT_246532 [Pseudomicrostroma glucosiphilum]PWN22601.1 hypothetical protein BCV69DRAFT_246532 [Pseudomicrostroma glucosiphilum]